MVRNPIPRRIRPYPNFSGRDGFHLPNTNQSHPKTGAKAMMKTGFTDWNQLAGISHPSRALSVNTSAKMVRDDPACSIRTRKGQRR